VDLFVQDPADAGTLPPPRQLAHAEGALGSVLLDLSSVTSEAELVGTRELRATLMRTVNGQRLPFTQCFSATGLCASPVSRSISLDAEHCAPDGEGGAAGIAGASGTGGDGNPG
jgi:hypothetical protein